MCEKYGGAKIILNKTKQKTKNGAEGFTISELKIRSKYNTNS